MKFFKLPIITILFGILFQLVFLFSHNILSLLLNTLPDDAFYYFQVARNITLGCGSAFDCVNLTNGYHPLWMLILLPIYKFFSVGGVNDVAPIYTALTLAVLMSGLTAFFLCKIFSHYTKNEKLISFGLFIYLFNPYVLYNNLNGLETSLVILLLSIFIYLFKSLPHPSRLSHARTYSGEEQNLNTRILFVGISGGLLALARLDMVIVVFFANLFFLYKYGKKGINYFFISGLTSAIIFISWMIYNFKTFGLYLTSASVTSTFINHRLTYSDNAGESWKVFLKTIPYMLERATQQILSDTGMPIVFLLLSGVGIYFLFKNSPQPLPASLMNRGGVINFFLPFLKGRLGGVFSPEIFVTVGLLALVFVSAGLRWTFRGWYFIPLLLVENIFLIWTLENSFREFKESKKQNLFLIVLVIFVSYSFFISWTKNLKDNQILQKTMYEATIWQNQNLPGTTRVGVFNAGLQAYFSNHKVINLDGLINNSASTAMLNNSLWQYITQTEHLDYVADFDSYMTYRYRDSFRKDTGELLDSTSSTSMEKIHTIPGPKDLNIYKVRY